MGDYYCKIGDYQTAKDIYNKILLIDPTAPMAYVGLGLILIDVDGELSNALELIERGLVITDSVHLLNNYAYALLLSERIRKARIYLIS